MKLKYLIFFSNSLHCCQDVMGIKP
uniref:Uncharacterized protein n=1 Tax=Arundo donax TaxID=35708 RepID=A0A0A9HK86_ARUDO